MDKGYIKVQHLSFVSFQESCSGRFEPRHQVFVPLGKDAQWHGDICAWGDAVSDKAADIVLEMLDDALGQVDRVFCGIWGCGLDDGVWHGLLDLNEGFDSKAENGSDVLGGDGLLASGGELGDGGGRVGGE